MRTDASALASVLAHYGVPFNPLQESQKVLCPIHDDKNPSMLIDLKEGTFFCFGCRKKGKAVDLVYAMEQKRGLSYLEAVRKCKDIQSSGSVAKDLIAPVMKRRIASKEELYDEAWDYYYGLANVNWLDEATLEADAIEALDYMESRGFTADALQYAQAKVTYRDSYSLIFPMLDNGEFKGWVSRTFDPYWSKRRKYLYSTGFSRATTLVGDYGDENWVVVVEGFMDRLRMIQNGLYNVVAILGWKMTAEQESKLHEAGVKHVISALDNDKCGREGTDWLRRRFETVTRWQYLKGVKDPGDMNRVQFNKMKARTWQEFEKRKDVTWDW